MIKEAPVAAERPFLRDRLKEMKNSLSTSLGALDVVLLGGMGELNQEQRRFLEVAKQNLEKVFIEVEKIKKSLETKPGRARAGSSGLPDQAASGGPTKL